MEWYLLISNKNVDWWRVVLQMTKQICCFLWIVRRVGAGQAEPEISDLTQNTGILRGQNGRYPGADASWISAYQLVQPLTRRRRKHLSRSILYNCSLVSFHLPDHQPVAFRIATSSFLWVVNCG